MKTKRRYEGQLLIENRHAPLPDPVQIERLGRATGKLIIAPQSPVYEVATVTCSHCHTIVIIRGERQRPRAWCWKCDRYICDRCVLLAKLHGCRPFAAVLDALDSKANNAVTF